MNSDLEVMKIAFNNYEKLRELSISKRQFKLIHHLNGLSATSRDVANHYDICVQNASQQLKNLFTKGYLTRVEIDDKTGGYLFEYTTNTKLFMSQMKDYDMSLAKNFCEIAQAVVSRPNNILKRVEKANDKVDFSSGRFQEIAIDIESISEDISSKNFDSMETLEDMFAELLARLDNKGEMKDDN